MIKQPISVTIQSKILTILDKINKNIVEPLAKLCTQITLSVAGVMLIIYMSNTFSPIKLSSINYFLIREATPLIIAFTILYWTIRISLKNWKSPNRNKELGKH